MTSCNQLTSLVAVDGARPITLDLLARDEAVELLTRRLGAGRVDAEPGAIDEIITRCARLPLALVAARAEIRPREQLRDLATELRDTLLRWQTLTGDDPDTDVRTVFSWSYRALTPDAARLFRLLGLHPAPDLSLSAAASLAGIPATGMRSPLAELISAHLIVEHTPGRYTLHDLLRSYASELAVSTDTEDDRRCAALRMLDHYLHTGYAADRLLSPAGDAITIAPAQQGVAPEEITDRRQAMAWFDVERQYCCPRSSTPPPVASIPTSGS